MRKIFDGKKDRVTIVLPVKLIQIIDNKVKQLEISRSEFFRNVLFREFNLFDETKKSEFKIAE